jgi:DNA-binding LacI/PurR family transcriptional regulator
MSRRLAEVAKKVGVSEATVSRVLNEKPGVSDATRQAVLTALDVLGYERPSKLRGERARLVGLFLPELTNPIFPAFGELVGAGLAQHGYTPVLCTQTVGGISEADYVELLLDQHVSGVVFVGGQYTQEDAPHDHYQRLLDLGLPTVLVNAPIAGLHFPTVSTDDAVAIEQAWSHLVQLGHRRIGLVLGPVDHIPSRRKLAAARRTAAQSGLSLDDEQVVHSHYSLEAGQAATARLLASGVTAVLCASDPLALGAVRAVRRAGKNVPADVSIVGFDDSALMNSTDPPLTTVRQPIEPMGRMVIELLVSQLNGTAAPADEYLFEPELVVRGSTGPAVLA